MGEWRMLQVVYVPGNLRILFDFGDEELWWEWQMPCLCEDCG